ncbi:transcription regulator [Phlyctema vagabunda]|uniref:Transcription regulator n=1 Tax=Phlyctema vagabunda TaxID=108571 RepID=A0ABR4PZ61_9HELO
MTEQFFSSAVSRVDWHQPQTDFYTFLVGDDKDRFHIQASILSAHSDFFGLQCQLRNKSTAKGLEPKIFTLPGISKEDFGCFQSYLFTGQFNHEIEDTTWINMYGIWVIGVEFEHVNLCTAVFQSMSKRAERYRTRPPIDILVRIFKSTENHFRFRRLFLTLMIGHESWLSCREFATDSETMQELSNALYSSRKIRAASRATSQSSSIGSQSPQTVPVASPFAPVRKSSMPLIFNKKTVVSQGLGPVYVDETKLVKKQKLSDQPSTPTANGHKRNQDRSGSTITLLNSGESASEQKKPRLILRSSPTPNGINRNQDRSRSSLPLPNSGDSVSEEKKTQSIPTSNNFNQRKDRSGSSSPLPNSGDKVSEKLKTQSIPTSKGTDERKQRSNSSLPLTKFDESVSEEKEAQSIPTQNGLTQEKDGSASALELASIDGPALANEQNQSALMSTPNPQVNGRNTKIIVNSNMPSDLQHNDEEDETLASRLQALETTSKRMHVPIDKQYLPNQMVTKLMNEIPKPRFLDHRAVVGFQGEPEKIGYCKEVMTMINSDDSWWEKVTGHFVWATGSRKAGPFGFGDILKPISLQEITIRLFTGVYKTSDHFEEELRHVFQHFRELYDVTDERRHKIEILEEAFDRQWICESEN